MTSSFNVTKKEKKETVGGQSLFSAQNRIVE